MKRLFITMLVAMAAISAQAQTWPQRLPNLDKLKYKTFENKFWSIDIPKQFDHHNPYMHKDSVIFYGGGKDYVAVANNYSENWLGEKRYTSISVSMIEAKYGSSASIKKFFLGANNVEILSKKEFEINGYKMTRTFEHFSDKKLNLFSVRYRFVVGETFVEIDICSEDINETRHFEPMIDKVVQSFKLKRPIQQ